MAYLEAMLLLDPIFPNLLKPLPQKEKVVIWMLNFYLTDSNITSKQITSLTSTF